MTDPGLAFRNGLPHQDVLPEEAAEQVRACCASSAWVAAILAGRPYEHRDDLLRRSAELLDRLPWADVREAIDAHPRIGDRVSGASREAALSRREQSGMNGATEDVRRGLVEANRAYEERFGHVFLIFASGRTDVEMLAAAQERIGNDDERERAIVREQLTRIVNRRLCVLLDGWEEQA